MYAMDSELLSHAQLTRLNAVHFKSIRRIFKVKSSYNITIEFSTPQLQIALTSTLPAWRTGLSG